MNKTDAGAHEIDEFRHCETGGCWVGFWCVVGGLTGDLGGREKERMLKGLICSGMRPLVFMVVWGNDMRKQNTIDDRGTKAVRYTLVACRHLLSHGGEGVSVALLMETLNSIGYTIREDQFSHRHSLKEDISRI